MVHISGYADVTYQRSENTAIELFEELAFSSSPGSTFAAVKAKLDACRTFTLLKDNAGSLAGTLTPVSFPRYASQEAGFLMSVPLPDPPSSYPLQLGYIIIRKGNYLVYVGYFPSTSKFNPHQLQPFIPLALAKVPSPNLVPPSPRFRRWLQSIFLRSRLYHHRLGLCGASSRARSGPTHPLLLPHRASGAGLQGPLCLLSVEMLGSESPAKSIDNPPTNLKGLIEVALTGQTATDAGSEWGSRRRDRPPARRTQPRRLRRRRSTTRGECTTRATEHRLHSPIGTFVLCDATRPQQLSGQGPTARTGIRRRMGRGT